MAVAVLIVVRLGAEIALVMRRPDLVLLDFWQSLRGTDRPSPQVVIVAIDEKSIARFGPPAWPRSEYVPLIERLANSGARVIGFDFTFAALEREAENNKLLARAIKKAGNIVFGYEFTEVGDPSPPGARASAVLQANALARFESPAIPPALSLIEPEPMLAEAAAAMGHVLTVVSEDGRIRVVPLFIQYGEKAYPSLALQIARVYTETPMEEVALTNGVARMGAWDIPVSASGEVLLNWPAAGAQAFPWYSFLDVVSGDVPDDAFRGKAVLVAGTAPRLDDRGPAFAFDVPGVLIYATFLDNVFRFDFVQAPTWAFLLEWGLFFVVCGLGVWLLPRLSTLLLLIGAPALPALLFGAAAFLFVQKGIWLKVVYPIFALLVPLGLLVALRRTASERETRDVAAEKLKNQMLLGLSFQEKGMLDEDVAIRMERLSQAGANVSLFPLPTAHAGPVPTPAQAAPESPLAHLLPTIVEDDEASTALSARAPSGPSQPPPAPPPTTAPRSPTPPPRPLTGVAAAGPAVTPAPGGPVLPGSRFGRYEVEQHLGRGGMGDVYLVRDTVINRKAALKTIRLDTDLDRPRGIEMRQRFYREAQTAGNLTHPNIVTIYDVGEDLGMSYIVMEFIEGNTLKQLNKQRLTLPQIKHVVYNAGMGLDYAHQNGIFHRDVKPDNIMVSKTGIVKVMDFGIARVVESSLTKTGGVMGTPSYMSPEQVQGQKVDARSDVFSLGIILYELLTGKKPFTGDTTASVIFAIIKADPAPPSTIDAKLHTAWDAILRKALTKEREGRYATAREFAQAVRDAPVR